LLTFFPKKGIFVDLTKKGIFVDLTKKGGA